MSLTPRGGSLSLGMIVAGLVLGGYVYAAWPDTSSRIVRLPYGEAMPKTPRAEPVRAIASYDAEPEPGLAGVAGAVYFDDYDFFQFGASPAIDAITAAPLPVEVG